MRMKHVWLVLILSLTAVTACVTGTPVADSGPRRSVVEPSPVAQSPVAQAEPARAPAHRYGSVPKGVTLEGTAVGMEPLTAVRYDKGRNQFILNRSIVYKNPVSAATARELAEALQRDDRLGVSFGHHDTPIVYGRLSKRGVVAQQLFDADRLLGGVAFARTEWLKGIVLPARYKPQKAHPRRIRSAMYANLTAYQFQKHELPDAGQDGIRALYSRITSDLELVLIPLSNRRARDGGHLPDMEKLKKGIVEPADKANLTHLEQNKVNYMEMPAVAAAVRLGEAAAFLRHVRDSGLSLSDLAGQLR